MAKQAVSQNASKVYIGAAIDLPLLLSSRRQFKRLCRCSPQRKENRASRLFRSERTDSTEGQSFGKACLGHPNRQGGTGSISHPS
jgi:hypothetical protein